MCALLLDDENPHKGGTGVLGTIGRPCIPSECMKVFSCYGGFNCMRRCCVGSLDCVGCKGSLVFCKSSGCLQYLLGRWGMYGSCSFCHLAIWISGREHIYVCSWPDDDRATIVLELKEVYGRSTDHSMKFQASRLQ